MIKKYRKKNKGQVIVEYVLLLVVSTAIALLLINMVKLEPNQNRPVFEYWKKILQAIAEDTSS